MALCLAAGVVVATLAVDTFTLAWTHSIEKLRWEEDWQIAGRTLVLAEARIRGFGAGMEPPAGAVLRDGAWHYRPEVVPRERLLLAHSRYTEGYALCMAGACRPLTELLPALPANATIELRGCDA